MIRPPISIGGLFVFIYRFKFGGPGSRAPEKSTSTVMHPLSFRPKMKNPRRPSLRRAQCGMTRHAATSRMPPMMSPMNPIVAVKKVATMVKDRTGCQGVNVVQNNGKAAGQIVSHVHFHVIPRNTGDSVVISYPRKQTDEKELDMMAATLTKKKSAALDEEIMREMRRI